MNYKFTVLSATFFFFYTKTLQSLSSPVSLLELLELLADYGGEGAAHHRPGHPILSQASGEQVDVTRVVVDAEGERSNRI